MRVSRTEITRKQKWEEKQLYGRFKRLTNERSYEKTWTWLRKGNLERETKSLLIAAQNNAIRTNHIKARPGNKRMSGDNPNNSIAEIGQNIEKSLGDSRSRIVTQIPVRKHRLTLV